MKKKKGSSLIFVLVAFAAITIFGVSVLSVTLVSYKKRFVESTEKRNQYFSESGLEVAYGIIGEIVDAGVKSGNEAVDAYMSTLNGETGILQQEKERLKNGEAGDPNKVSDKNSTDLEKYINPDGSSKYIEEDGVTVKESYVKWQQNERFKNAYKIYVTNSITTEWLQGDITKIIGTIPINDEDYKSQYESQESNINKPTVEIYNKKNVNDKVSVEFSDISNYRNTGKKQSVLPLYLKSTFTEKSVKKTITVDYDILTPDYNRAYYTSTNNFKLPISSVWNNKAFSIDGDLKIAGNFSVTGDTYVKGTDTVDGGISVERDKSFVTFTGNASTSQNFKISKPYSTINVDGNVYAGNVEIAEGADGSNITVQSSVFTNNDLALNAALSHINIANFYGINDISKLENKIQTKISSSIRVNTDDLGSGSSIAISNEAIVMGTAYIKTNDSNQPFYQTGESVAIKGNYRAYTDSLASDEATRQAQYYGGDPNKPKQSLKEENILFDYINPLQLITKFKDGTDINWQDKSDYFSIYVNEHKNDIYNGLNLGNGITLPMATDLKEGERADKNIIHTGAIIANGNVYNGNYYADNQGKVAEKQNSFASMVYEMGDSKDLANVYAQGKVKKAVSSLDPKVESQIDFTKVKSTTVDEVVKNSTNDIIYLNNDDSKDCIIVGKDALNIPNGTKVKLDADGKGRGIIITKGNVYLSGSIDFTGVIIAAGNVVVIDENQKQFTTDNSYIQKLISYNYDEYFKGVFTGTPEATQNIETNVEINTNDNIKGDVIRKNFIVMKNWKIEK